MDIGGGVDNFKPEDMFFKNKIKATREQMVMSSHSPETQRFKKFKNKIASVLDHKGRINPELWNELNGLDMKIKQRIAQGESDVALNMNIDEKIQKYYQKSLPAGASKSMSPYLLANTFKVDFYSLYRD